MSVPPQLLISDKVTDRRRALGRVPGKVIIYCNDFQGSNPVMLLYLIVTLTSSMFISQEHVPEIGSLLYWLLLLPALVLPVLNAREVFVTAFKWPMILLPFMLFLAGTWHLLVGDPQTVPRMVLLVVVIIWLSSNVANVRISHIVAIYIAILIFGIFVYLLTPLNKWGPLPGLTAEDFGVWRVSFFPNIAYTAFLSLFIFMLLSINGEIARKCMPIMLLAAFYTLTSFVRTATIGLGLFMVTRILLNRIRSPRKLFWISVCVAILANLTIALSPLIVFEIQQFPLVSRLFLRGQTNLNIHDIYIQMFRPWVWGQHMHIFISSPYLMGWGEFDFNRLKSESLVDIIDWSDTVSMPTRLLASHGLPAVLFFWFCFAQLARRAKELDIWACAAFPTFALLAMQWGSLLHPADPIFFLYFLILVGGAKAFKTSAGAGHPASYLKEGQPA